MTKKALTKAPLIHAVIQVRFTAIPEVENISEKDMSKLHKKMVDGGFPEKIIAKFDQVSINIDTSTQATTHRNNALIRYLFRGAGESETIELFSVNGTTSIILKSTSYINFNEFYSKFNKLLSIYLDVFPSLDKVLLKSIGLRYVNLIVPNSTSALSEFVQDSVIPMSIKTLQDNKNLHGFSQRYVAMKPDSQLKVAFEEIPMGENRSLTKILPDDLGEKDPSCGLMIPIQEVWKNITSPTYGILDIENIKEFQGSPKFDLKEIKNVTNILYENCSKVFWGVITDQAKEAWEVYDVE
ncbi:hypothetical protein MNBD_UNCLBAC01-1233 [hydrothermal vent metagenome]|uniref:TIGR04255 family protein n=1 Tax=hydrothermal vent metagenome TaxID=652676 RepID=A0A3B1DP88_9ZZZZ